MFTAKVYRIMVGSLSGAMEEVHVAKETIRKWNQQNAERSGKVFMPIDWETNSEAILKTDIVVGIIDNWLDNPRFIQGCVDAGKQVMLFFNAVQDATNTLSCEQESVNCLKDGMKDRCCIVEYKGTAEFSSLLDDRLTSF